MKRFFTFSVYLFFILIFITISIIHAENLKIPVLTTYENEYLTEIAFPIGGIGTGTLSIGGRGNLRDWEIMNRPSKGFAPTFGFFTLWSQSGTNKADTRVLEGILQPPYSGASGVPNATAGLPRFRGVKFYAAYPFCMLEFKDPSTPLEVHLEIFNPLIPLDPENSGLPVAVFRYTLFNPTNEPVKAGIAGSLQNFIGSDGVEKLKATYKNEFRKAGDFSGLFYSANLTPFEAPQNGTIALISNGNSISYRRHWARDGWRNDLLSFWDDFSEDGILTDPPESPDQSYAASLSNYCIVPPQGSSTVTFMLCWHFPNRTAKGSGWAVHEGFGDGYIGNYYTTQFKDAWDVAEKTYPQLGTLEQESLKFVKTFCESTLPQAIKEAALNNLSTLRTQVCFRTPDGHLFGFEGDNDKSGCCMGSCTHVWNYQTADAFVFPSLARSMRDVELRYSTYETTGMSDFRTKLPLKKVCECETPFGAAADGQMGVIMKLYREWQLSGDDNFLRTLYPYAKKALSFAWIPGGWDADQNGVMEGIQHNTYDVEFYGPNSMMTSWYLGALRSSEEMARAMGDAEFAGKCRSVFEKGSHWVDENLYNGEYYIQIVQGVKDLSSAPKGLILGMGSKDPANPDFQVGTGCLTDQLLGQYMAHVVGLGYLLDSEHVRKAMNSIYKYNFKNNLFDHFNNLRTYALNDEAGLLICSWPRGGRPAVPFPYFSEVWTGIEYQAAASMIYEGMIEEGINVVKGARARHDGRRRNPWDEPECGHHYARAMSSWSTLIAFSGFQYSGVKQIMKFNPQNTVNDFQSFWSAGSGWGVYAQKFTGNNCDIQLDLKYGSMTLKIFEFGIPTGVQIRGEISVTVGNDSVKAMYKRTDGMATIEFSAPLTIEQNKPLHIILN